MADSVEARMSVISIRRVDPYIRDILATSSHVALYKFNPAINEWEKSDTEGAIFLYSRTGQPWHSLIIMNRLSTQNLIEPIVRDFEFQLQPPFVLYRNSDNKIYGIWFYDREECVNITRLLEQLVRELRDGKQHQQQQSLQHRQMEQPVKPPAVEPVASGTAPAVDIFSILTKAQEDFNNKTAVTTVSSSTPVKVDSSGTQPKFSSTPRAPDAPSQSVMDFFAKAGGSTNKIPKTGTVSGTPTGNGPAGDNLLHRLMSNPAHSVEHIEKQQRSITPQNLANKPTPRALKTIFPLGPQLADSSSSLADTSVQLPDTSGPYSPSCPIFSSAEDRVASPLANFLDTTGLPSSPKPQLLPPMMFETSTQQRLSATNSRPLAAPADSSDIPLLTAKQMQQAFIHLLKNNTEFVAELHEAYVRSVNEKLNTGGGSVK